MKQDIVIQSAAQLHDVEGRANWHLWISVAVNEQVVSLSPCQLASGSRLHDLSAFR